MAPHRLPDFQHLGTGSDAVELLLEREQLAMLVQRAAPRLHDSLRDRALVEWRWEEPAWGGAP